MKTILITLAAVLLASCVTLKKVDTTGFHSSNNTIFYENDSVAVLSAIEYSIDDKKYVKEMTLKLVDMKHADKVKNLLYFVHERHNVCDIEIDYPITNFKLK